MQTIVANNWHKWCCALFATVCCGLEVHHSQKTGPVFAFLCLQLFYNCKGPMIVAIISLATTNVHILTYRVIQRKTMWGGGEVTYLGLSIPLPIVIFVLEPYCVIVLAKLREETYWWLFDRRRLFAWWLMC